MRDSKQAGRQRATVRLGGCVESRQAAYMRTTFLDSSFLLALIHPDDPQHERAAAWQRVIRGEFVTTEYHLVQLADALLDESKRRLALEMLWLLRADPGVGVVPASTALMEEGLRLLDESEGRDWTLTDCMSFAVMRHAGLMDVLTTNHYFEQAGFRSLLRMEPPREPDVVRPEVRAALCEAIASHRVVRFDYHRGQRVVEPYRYGRSVMGHELLRAYQRRGYSASGEPAGWKTFRVAEIESVTLTDERFGAVRPAYSPAESAMSEVFCQI